MINNRPWVAFFSHTGSEIANISKKLGAVPDIIVTNNKDEKNISKHVKNYKKSSIKPTPEEYSELIEYDNPIVTLHGWMRIVPKSVCAKFEIYNLHPGLITEYPELKGKDPQQRVFEMLNHPQHVGCVIHRVIPEVDSGEVLMTRKTFNSYPSVSMLNDVLHSMASDMWIDFFEQGVYNNSDD